MSASRALVSNEPGRIVSYASPDGRYWRYERPAVAVRPTGRSDFPNQINNVLVFPGVFRGLLDAQSSSVSIEMELAAAKALAGVVTDDELNADYIVPSVFHPEVHTMVAHAVRDACGGKAPAAEVFPDDSPSL